MKTNRELLELAAKAAGIELMIFEDDDDAFSPAFRTEGGYWNPLTDDGDALRLAVKLGITIDMRLERVKAFVDELPHAVEEYFMNDPFAATRRAIVRAAADIGETK